LEKGWVYRSQVEIQDAGSWHKVTVKLHFGELIAWACLDDELVGEGLPLSISAESINDN
jgi:hypothetical protein